MRKLIAVTSIFIVGVIIMSYLYFTNQDTVIITDSIKASRREVTDMSGVTFLINGDIKATSISRITEDAKYKKNKYYEYSATDEYKLFCVNKMIIIAQKNTSFHFNDNEKPYQTLQEAQISDLEFKMDSTALNFVQDKDGANMNVSAHIKLNPNTEINYAGKLKTLVIENTEWAMFTGYCEDSYDLLSETQKEEIDSVIDSFKPVKQIK